jgi:hypothetical protein
MPLRDSTFQHFKDKGFYSCADGFIRNFAGPEYDEASGCFITPNCVARAVARRY